MVTTVKKNFTGRLHDLDTVRVLRQLMQTIPVAQFRTYRQPVSQTIGGYWGSKRQNHPAIAHGSSSSILLGRALGRSEVPAYSISRKGGHRRRITSQRVRNYCPMRTHKLPKELSYLIYDCHYESSRYPCCVSSSLPLAEAGQYHAAISSSSSQST